MSEGVEEAHPPCMLSQPSPLRALIQKDSRGELRAQPDKVSGSMLHHLKGLRSGLSFQFRKLLSPSRAILERV